MLFEGLEALVGLCSKTVNWYTFQKEYLVLPWRYCLIHFLEVEVVYQSLEFCAENQEIPSNP